MTSGFGLEREKGSTGRGCDGIQVQVGLQEKNQKHR